MAKKIKINGKTDVISLNLEKRIYVDWRDLGVEQTGFKIQTYEGSELVFETAKLKSNEPFGEIRLPLTPQRKKYDLRLSIWDGMGREQIFEEFFYSGNPGLKDAKWITRLDNPIEKEWTYYDDRPNMIFEKRFDYQGSGEAFLDLSGLGYFTAWINGQRLGDSYLTTDPAQYRQSVYYDSFRVGEHLRTGENVLTIELANGWFNPAPLQLLGRYNVRKKMAVGKPCLLAQLTFEDSRLKTIASDSTWTCRDGAYLFNNLFIGEKVLGNHPSGQSGKTVQIPGPSGKLIPSHIPKIKRKRRLLPQEVLDTEKGILLDFGQVVSGHFCCTFSELLQGSFKLTYFEGLYGDGTPDHGPSSCGIYGYDAKALGKIAQDQVIQQDEILKERGSFRFENQYCYHSFRYVLIEGRQIKASDLSDIWAFAVHTDVVSTGTFETSAPDLNLLWEGAKATKLNNIHGLFEDCPRERLGYGGDIVALLDSQVYTFEIEQLLLKVFQDFADDQGSDGGITQTAPYMGIQTNGTSERAGSLGWQLVLPVLAEKIRSEYYQPHFIEDNRQTLQKHLDYLLSFDYDYIKHCCLGDWGSMDGELMASPDQQFCSAVMYGLIIEAYSKILPVSLEKLDEIRRWIHLEFYQEGGFYQTGSQSSYAFALKAGLGNRTVLLENLIKQIERDGGLFRSGIFGNPWTQKLLSEAGRPDLVYQWLTRAEAPGFLEMLSQGGGISREHFDAARGSYNHGMFTSYSAWLVENILGLQWDSSKGQLIVAPYFSEKLSWVKGGIKCRKGGVEVSYERFGNRVQMELIIPMSLSFEVVYAGNHQINPIHEAPIRKVRIVFEEITKEVA